MGTEERMEPGLGEGERGAGSKERGGEVTKSQLQKTRRAVRSALIERDGTDCHWCGGPMVIPDGQTPCLNQSPDLATIEHLTERRHGGSDDLDNLVLAHHRCNRKRDHAKRAEEREHA